MSKTPQEDRLVRIIKAFDEPVKKGGPGSGRHPGEGSGSRTEHPGIISGHTSESEQGQRLEERERQTREADNAARSERDPTQHRVGGKVFINAPGYPHHGMKGKVTGTSPSGSHVTVDFGKGNSGTYHSSEALRTL